MSLIFLVILTSVFSFVTCKSNCKLANTCGQCIGHSFQCVWCPAAGHSGPRCAAPHEVDIGSWCSKAVINPRVKQIIANRNDSINTGRGGSKVVQLQPQDLTVIVRPGETVHFTVKYQPAEHYPLDVYYLLDYSYTMTNFISVLQAQGAEIYRKLSTFTNNLQLGIGSFVEKPGLPFASPNQRAYSFRNHLSLTNATEQFAGAIKLSEFGANNDDPEACLDALMQAMVCQHRVGWRNASRRIIVLCTDATYHSAGDGKIVGAAKLNDMECHLNTTDYYDLALLLDYPTVNQINKIAMRENTIIIFNAHKKHKRVYEALANKIQGSKYVELKQRSNIVDTITKVYLDTVNYLQMGVKVPNDNIRVLLTPNCIQPNNEGCNVKHQQENTIDVALQVKACVPGGTAVTIAPVGLDESLTIHIRTVCECECERSGPHVPVMEAACSNRGYLQCGICKCNENSFGESCQCDGSSTMIDWKKCKANEDDTVLCNGRGNCRCGQCQCFSGFSGNLCQYDDNGCPRVQGRLCGGRGECTYGHCVCAQGYEGDDCRCPTSQDVCRPPHSQHICSGNGNCICGECDCTKVDSQNKKYSGTFCEECDECDEIRCKELEKYVQCVYFKTQKVCDEELKMKNTDVVMVNKTEINSPKYDLAKLCKTELEDGKSIVFKHYYEGKVLQIIIQKELEEPSRAKMWIAIGSSIGAILLLGLLAIVGWKVVMDLKDKREYERFTKKLDEAADPSNVNPFYKDPTAKFQNPAYKRKSRITT